MASPVFLLRPGPGLFVFCRQHNSTAMEEEEEEEEEADCPNGIPEQIKVEGTG